jgi:transposase
MKQIHNNTNETLKQLTEKTLIISVDVSKITHVARATDYRGIELSKTHPFNNNIKGFRELLKWIHLLTIAHKKPNVVIGMEPTGPYGHTLAQFLKSSGFQVVLVLGKQVNAAKELDDNTPSKNDYKDALIIAKLISEGRFRKLREHNESISSLKEAMSYSRQLTKDLTRVKCRIDNWICVYFPEFSILFKDWTKKTAYATLKCFPMPEDINALNTFQIVSKWRKNGVLRGIGAKKAFELKTYAKNSTGLKSAAEFAGMHIRGLISQYERLLQESDELWSAIDVLLKGIPLYSTLTKIPHIGRKAACGIAAELGNVSDFSHPKQLIRLAGLSITQISSGKKRGMSQIIKRGRPHLRHWLYMAVLNLLKEKEPSFWALHKHYTTRKDNPLKPMQSVIALCCKLLRVIFGMCVKGTDYDPALITSGISKLNAA